MAFFTHLVSLVAVLVFVAPAAQPLWLLAMCGALSSAEVRRFSDRVELRSLDGVACGVALLLAAVGAPLLWFSLRAVDVSIPCTLLACALPFVTAHGCRVRLRVRSDSAECVRKVLWLVPWRRVALANPCAWVDGWGDFSDPEALYVGEAGYAEGSYQLELAWGSAGSGDRAEQLVAELDRAVRELRGA